VRRSNGLKLQATDQRIMSNRSAFRGLLAERDALAAAREQLALTQHFFGDPPPGYSALHGKTGLR
jgi:hypothetical protein